MKKAPTSPLDIYSANLAYVQRLADLAQQSHARWLAFGQQMAGVGAAHMTTLGPLTPSADWHGIAPAIGDMATKRWQCGLDASNALTQTILEEQNAWSAGTSTAISDWLRDATGANNGLGTQSVTKMWSALTDQWNNACKALPGATQSGGTRHGG